MKLLITVVSGFIYLIGLIIYAVHLNLLWKELLFSWQNTTYSIHFRNLHSILKNARL